MSVRGVHQKVCAVLGNLTGEDWASIHFKLALGLAWPAAFILTEDGLAAYLGRWLVIPWMAVTAVGTFISIAGMMMTAQGGMTRLRGFRVELIGLVVFLSGPLTYMGGQIGYMIETDQTYARLAQIIIAYALSAAVIMRILKVLAVARRALYPGKLTMRT